MRISDIHIERFGAWRNLNLSLPNHGLSVIYGPNEAGKSTLLKFIRGVLYGFPPAYDLVGGADTGSALPPRAGALRLDWNGWSARVQRTDGPEAAGSVEVRDYNGSAQAGQFFPDVLQNMDEALFQRVFAIGLRELQELGTLHDRDVADHIYGMTLGPDGQQLLAAGERLTSERRRWLDVSDKKDADKKDSDKKDPAREAGGELPALWRRHDELSRKLELLAELPRRRRELLKQREQLETEIAGLKQRQQGIQSQLRGHACLQRVWSPWNRVRECTLELEQLPVVRDFPEQGVERLAKLERELAEATASRQALLAESKRLLQKAAGLRINAELRSQAGAIQGLLDQQAWHRDVESQLSAVQGQADSLKADLDARLEKLGPAWTLKRLETTDVSPAAHYRLATMARSFRAAWNRRAKVVRVVERFAARCQAQADELNAQLEEVGGRACLPDVLENARNQLGELERLGQLQVREAELEHRQVGLAEQCERLEARLVLPNWVYLVLGFFGIAGLGLIGAGVTTGVTASTLIGAIYTLLGATCGGLAWALKKVFENDVHQQLVELDAEAEANREQLREARREIRASAVEAGYEGPAGDTVPDHADLLHAAAHRIAELEQLTRRDQQLDRARRKLSRLRSSQQACERELGTARQSWQELLGQLGFAPNLRSEEAFDAWKLVGEAVELRRQREAAVQDANRLRWIHQAFTQRVEAVAGRLPGERWEPRRTQQLLSSWQEQLRSYAANRKERQKLQLDSRARRKEAVRFQRVAADVQARRTALLAQGGATNRPEFEARAQQAARRIVLQAQLVDARRDLDAAAQTDRDLAIAEEDLRAYNARGNTECIEMLNMELEDLGSDLRQSFEKVGGIKHELQVLDANRESADLRWEREQVAAQIRHAAEQWFALQLAGDALAGVRAHYEKNCQPALLAEASQFLSRLTCGKYRNIWTPLGERQLRIDDEGQRSLPVEHLSRGTREQLFLAIRLALVREFARRGTRLPMVLDDVLVNFDEQRTQAAVEVVQDFAAAGHQVLLFTSHLSLAKSFEGRGISPIWLPDYHAHLSENRIERLAG